MRILLLLGLLQPAPTLDCRRHPALCTLLGSQAQDFAQKLWRLRLIGGPDLNRQAARLRAQASVGPVVASPVGEGPVALERIQWRLYGARESVVIGRSYEQREGLWLPSSVRVCLERMDTPHAHPLCANEDYLSLSSPQSLGRVCLSRGTQTLCLD
ncbi:MAG: hypothetical protein ACI9VR_004988 [Cognaticolwellia sp.]|jgi:hypothetical protein